MKKQNWLHSPLFDSLFILSPGFLSILFVFFLQKDTSEASLTPWLWFVFVVGVDVSHVYSSLFKTYLDSSSWKTHGKLYLGVPLFCFLFSYFLYQQGELVFWRVAAYLAVFHFVRQQYGFMRLYERVNPKLKPAGFLGKSLIYLATLYPLVHWHCHLPKNFFWFVKGDFLTGLPLFFDPLVFLIYVTVAFFYFWREISLFKKGEANCPKNLLILSTMLSWYVGIVYLNDDLAFTITNILAHGIPYIALISLEEKKKKRNKNFSSVYSLFFFLFGVSFLFAYGEEFLWAHFVWEEYLEFFPFFSDLQSFEKMKASHFLVPLLALPQITHYVLDAFIWKRR